MRDTHGANPITLEAVQRGGFPMGGENLAIDLADTVVTVAGPPVDLLATQADADRFWTLHQAWLPAQWAAPSLDRTRLMRDQVRELFDALVEGRGPRSVTLDALNEAARLACVTPEAHGERGGFRPVEIWKAADAADLPLAAVARSAIAFITTPAALRTLRRCSSPSCSMLYFRGDARRKWCTPNICGNRDRVARHHRRRKEAK